MLQQLNDEQNNDSLEIVKNGISFKEGSLVKINPKYNYPNDNIFKIVKIITLGECRILTQKYYENREEADKNEYYNNFIDRLIEMVEEEYRLIDIKAIIKEEITNNKGLIDNEDDDEEYNTFSVFDQMFKYISDISSTPQKNKITKMLRGKKRKNKQYKNFSMLLNNLTGSKLGFGDDDILLSICHATSSKNNKPIWQMAKGVILILPDGKEVELWDKI